jgi:hypothetical protein
MSAYIVDRDHIAYLIEAAMSQRMLRGSPRLSWYWEGRRYELDPGASEGPESASAVGQMLWDENIASVRYRYPDDGDDLPGPVGEAFVYLHGWTRADAPDPVQVFKSIACYRYQSCEHPGWEKSQAFAFCDALERAAARALPGWDDATWGAPEPKVVRR